jgi:hypothetical protein
MLGPALLSRGSYLATYSQATQGEAKDKDMTYLSRRCREIKDEERHRNGEWVAGIDFGYGHPSDWYWDKARFADTRRRALDYPYTWRGRGG